MLWQAVKDHIKNNGRLVFQAPEGKPFSGEKNLCGAIGEENESGAAQCYQFEKGTWDAPSAKNKEAIVMMNHKIRIKSDKYKGYLEKQKEMMKDMGMDEEAMEESLDHCVPVDLYGKRVNLDQNDSENFEETAEDIKEVYGLNDY